MNGLENIKDLVALTSYQSHYGAVYGLLGFVY